MGLRAHYETSRSVLKDMIEARWDHTARVGHNTTATMGWDEPSAVIVRYHGHPIVALHENGDISLSDCGWQTSTTKERLNLYAPHGVGIWQENFVWYYKTINQTRLPWHGTHRFTAEGTERVEVDA